MKTHQQKVSKLLELGFSPSLVGFRAILELAEVWKPTDKITVYYHTVGRKLGTTGSAVERAIRSAIKRTMLFNNEGMKAFMGNTYNPYKGYPTVAEFMAMLWLDFNEADT